MNDHQVMAAITRAMAPPDSESEKEWVCVGLIVESPEFERLSGFGGWGIRPSNLLDPKITVEWRFLQKMSHKRGFFGQEDRGEFSWVEFRSTQTVVVDSEAREKIQKELSKCLS